MNHDVVVVGAGLAGLSCGVELAAKGYAPLILESNDFVGGRTSSWNQDGMEVETGLHRFLGFFSHLPDLLQKVGINLDEMLAWEDEVEIRTPDGQHTVLGLAPLHKPLKTLSLVMGNWDFLNLAEKTALGKFFAAGLKQHADDPLGLDEISVADYARQRGMTERAITRLLVPLTEGLFFLPVDQYSAYVFFSSFGPYMKNIHKLRIGAFTGGMTSVMAQPVAGYITANGGKVITGAKATELMVANGRVVGVKTAEQQYRAGQIVLATPLGPAQDLIKEALPGEDFFSGMLKLKSMTSVTFQLELTKPAMPVDRTTFGPTTNMASFTEQSRTTFRRSEGRLSIILAPPEKFIDMPEDEILNVVLEDCRTLQVELDRDMVKDCRKVVIPNDFYRLSPGQEKLRPAQLTPVPGLILAGDYTKQEYITTMEGAVYSGKLAAECVAQPA